MSTQGLPAERRIYTVAELNEEIKGTLESQFFNIWVEGEISNFRTPASGHHYLTLKDDTAQLRAVCFRSQNRLLRFRPEDGLAVLARGSLTVYEPRGEYQLVIDTMEPMGLGSLQLAFEQLKAKLQKEGLFEAARKKKLPLLPQRIGVVTSPTGAAISDILRILKRRDRCLNVLVYPVKVQGDGAAAEIAAGVRHFGSGRDAVDVLIVGRGGGSIEDLWAFNEEIVARAIHQSRVPVISAVGHEVDFTIADFVADLRAPTPSAAAEMVSAVRAELQERTAGACRRLALSANRLLHARRQTLQLLGRSRAFSLVEGRIHSGQQRVDELSFKSISAVRAALLQKRNRHALLERRLERVNPLQVLHGRRAQLDLQCNRAHNAMQRLHQGYCNRLAEGAGKLQALSPLAILARGYAICLDRTGRILTDALESKPQDQVSVRLSRGRLECEVKEVRDVQPPNR